MDDLHKCLECGNVIKPAPWSKRQKYCSKNCFMGNYNKKMGKMKFLDLPTSTIGTISELEVFLDLARKGYEVYRPLGTNSSADLVIEKDGNFKKIEVRTGMRNEINGVIMYPKKNIRAAIIAIFLAKTREIIYIGEEL